MQDLLEAAITNMSLFDVAEGPDVLSNSLGKNGCRNQGLILQVTESSILISLMHSSGR